MTCAVLAFSTYSGAAGERYASLSTGYQNVRPVYAAVGGITRSPIGWVEFCVEYKAECATKP